FSVDTIKVFSIEIEFKVNSEKSGSGPYESPGRETASIIFATVKRTFSYGWMKNVYVYSVHLSDQTAVKIQN
ncbi:MAG TPA: hypothetical protein VGO58_01530, partial [Chitinophagaceae bacterium]|nr:hypothetical protein [Chitinophagaceae bacterium]